jgi:hypothetical protein
VPTRLTSDFSTRLDTINAWSNILPFPAASASFFWLLVLAQVAAVAVVLVVGGTRWSQFGAEGASFARAIERAAAVGRPSLTHRGGRDGRYVR